MTHVYYTDSQNGIHNEQYLYNGDGERVYVINDGSLTGHLYDNGRVIAEYNDNDTVTTQYVHGSGLGGDVGSMIRSQSLTADTDNDGEADSIDNRAYFYNWRGDVIDLLDGEGNTVFSYRYDAFGSTVSCLAYSGAQAAEMNEPDASNPFLFSSKRFGFDTQLSYFGARYYDASIGQFISRDPMRYIDGPNMFVYVANNPMRYIDPFGLWKRGISIINYLDILNIFNVTQRNLFITPSMLLIILNL